MKKQQFDGSVFRVCISSLSLPGNDDEEDSGEEHLPSCFDYIMHFLTVFWKVLFAFVPPTEYWNGWACFFVSISLIGALTAVTGDLASHFGCTIGLKDSVTAVVFVALGTSVPGGACIVLSVSSNTQLVPQVSSGAPRRRQPAAWVGLCDPPVRGILSGAF